MMSMYSQGGPPPNLGPPPPHMGANHLPGVSPTNTSMPPPHNTSMPPPTSQNTPGSNSFQQLQFKPFKTPDLSDFDGKRLRKSVMRKTVDYNSSIVAMLESRVWQRDERDRCALQPDISFASELMPPQMYSDNPINSVVTKFVRTSTNKQKCPVFALAWTPEGRRLVTGASSGEFTLWNGLTFNFETILKAHESSVRSMLWSHNDQWMVTADTGGIVKYWQTNMNNVKQFQAHKDPIRGLSFSPFDQKLATCSDDGTVRIWDFFRCLEERVLRGHGADVKCVAWHPYKSLLASGSKDNQQPIKLWDPRNGTPLAKLHAHKSTVMDLKWNSNGNWLCSASRDHLLKLFDIRNLSVELQVFRGHKKEASCIAWHPQHEGLFSSGGSDGSVLFWHVGNDREVGSIDAGHDGIIWDIEWHPLGHILSTASNDHTTKFWTRNRPGDKMRDKYNLNTLPAGVLADDSMDIDDIPISGNYANHSMPGSTIPGMGPDDKITSEVSSDGGSEAIPGLDFDAAHFERFIKKTPYAKPIPKNFQAAWNAAGGLEDEVPFDPSSSWVITNVGDLFGQYADTKGPKVITDTGEELPAGSVPLSELNATAIAYSGFYIPLQKVSAQDIADAFTLMTEEEGIGAITNDFDFARKFCREKRIMLNPNAKDEEGGGSHRNQEDPFNYHNTQPASGGRGRGRGRGNYEDRGRGFRGNRGFRGGGGHHFNEENHDGHYEDFGRGRGNRGGWRSRGRGRGGFDHRNNNRNEEEWEGGNQSFDGGYHPRYEEFPKLDENRRGNRNQWEGNNEWRGRGGGGGLFNKRGGRGGFEEGGGGGFRERGGGGGDFRGGFRGRGRNDYEDGGYRGGRGRGDRGGYKRKGDWDDEGWSPRGSDKHIRGNHY